MYIVETGSRIAVTNLLSKQCIDAVGPDVEDLFRRRHKVDRLRAKVVGRYETERQSRIQLHSKPVTQTNHHITGAYTLQCTATLHQQYSQPQFIN